MGCDKPLAGIKKTHTPERMCVVSRKVCPRHQLIRLVCDASGRVVLDRSQKMAGRGAYLLPQPGLIDKALQRRALERALRVKLNDDDLKRLRIEFEQACLGDSHALNPSHTLEEVVH